MSRVPAIVFCLFIATSLQAQSSSQSQPIPQPMPVPQPPLPTTRFPEVRYFSLEHRAPEQMDAADVELVLRHAGDIRREAEFYGYDLSAGAWSHTQSVCPMMPEHIMLQYVSNAASPSESRFTVLVPRQGGRVKIVPVIKNTAARFLPAPKDPRNFRLFADVVPRDAAKQNSGPEGKWLTQGVCYAELTGGWAEVPSNPQADLHMIKAPQPTIRISADRKEHEVSFIQPISATSYRLWDILYNLEGHIVAASDDVHVFGERVIFHPAEPPVVEKPVPAPPVPVVKPTPPAPPTKVTPLPPQ